jgi:hypothetical protein
MNRASKKKKHCPNKGPKGLSTASAESRPVFYWRIPFMALAVVVASVPFYGFFVHAARDPHEIALVIVACWFLTWVSAISSIVLAAKRPPQSRAARAATVIINGYLLIAGIIGYAGAGNAIGELIAG